MGIEVSISIKKGVVQNLFHSFKALKIDIAMINEAKEEKPRRTWCWSAFLAFNACEFDVTFLICISDGS